MFEDFFTTYTLIKPPEIISDNDLFEYNLDNYSPEHSSINYNTNYNDFQYPGLTNPFENNYETNFYNYLNYTLALNTELLKLDIEDLLKQEGITSVNGKPIKFGSKEIRTWGKETSHHRRKDDLTGYASARDISIVGGNSKDYLDFRKLLLDNLNVREWMLLKNWGIINEITPQILSQTKGTGNHFHFGPDKWAVNTWKAWIDNPNSLITKSFRYYNSSSYKISNNEFVKILNETYKKVLQERGLNPEYSIMLTALDVNESGWGKHTIGTYNYGNIMATNNNYTKDKNGNKWQNYNSMEDYINNKINILLKDRYKFFLTFSPNGNISVAMQTLANRGYAPGNYNYGANVANTYKSILKYLS